MTPVPDDLRGGPPNLAEVDLYLMNEAGVEGPLSHARLFDLLLDCFIEDFAAHPPDIAGEGTPE